MLFAKKYACYLFIKSIIIISEENLLFYIPKIQALCNLRVGIIETTEGIHRQTGFEIFVQVTIPVNINTDDSTLTK